MPDVSSTNVSPNETEELKKKEKARKLSIIEGSAYSINEGAGMRYITPFALSMGATNTQIGLLSAVPSLLGNFSQLFTSKAMEKYSRSKICFLGAFLQALMWLIVVLVGALYFYLDSSWAPSLLIIVYSLLVLFGSFINPAWNSWMSDIIDRNILGKYFGIRTRIVGFVVTVVMLLAGFLLDYYKNTHLFIIFAILFILSLIGRAISAFLFRKIYEPELKLEKTYSFSFINFIKSMTKTNFGKFVLLASTLIFALNIAVPFFAVYMLKELHFNYVEFTIITMSSIVSSLLFVPAWGKFADKYGNFKVLKISCYFLPGIPLLWLFSIFIHSSILLLIYLTLVEIINGFALAGFNLSAVNFMYESMDRQQLALGVSYFNILAGIGIFVGATLGGYIASHSFTIFFLTPLLFVFALSWLIRSLVILILLPKIKEVRECQLFGFREAREKIRHMTPSQAFQYLELDLIRHGNDNKK